MFSSSSSRQSSRVVWPGLGGPRRVQAPPRTPLIFRPDCSKQGTKALVPGLSLIPVQPPLESVPPVTAAHRRQAPAIRQTNLTTPRPDGRPLSPLLTTRQATHLQSRCSREYPMMAAAGLKTIIALSFVCLPLSHAPVTSYLTLPLGPRHWVPPRHPVRRSIQELPHSSCCAHLCHCSGAELAMRPGGKL
jgi:hypothetical protein